MKRIQNIVFDLGAVLINLDYNKSVTAFKELGYNEFEKMYSLFSANQVFDDFEKGRLTEAEFYAYMADSGSENLSNNQLRKAWNAMLADFRIGSIQFLQQLKKNHPLYLLSNTNSIHRAAFESIFQKQTGLESLSGLFTKAYYSHLIGMRKPDAEIFKFLAKDAGILPSESLFIDDLLKNVAAAEKLGFHVIQLMPGEQIENLDYAGRGYLISS